MDSIHGGGQRITELYIPTLGIVLNSMHDRVICFKEDGFRYKESDELFTNNSEPKLEGSTYVPFKIANSAADMLFASDVLNKEKKAISKLLKVKKEKK